MTKQRLLSQSHRQLPGGSGSFNADGPARETLLALSPEERAGWAEAARLHLLSLGCKGGPALLVAGSLFQKERGFAVVLVPWKSPPSHPAAVAGCPGLPAGSGAWINRNSHA